MISKHEGCVCLFLVACLIVFCVSGCTNATWDSTTSLGSDAKIEFYQDGEVVRTFVSDGKPLTGKHGNRVAFREKSTGHYIRILDNTIIPS